MGPLPEGGGSPGGSREVRQGRRQAKFGMATTLFPGTGGKALPNRLQAAFLGEWPDFPFQEGAVSVRTAPPPNFRERNSILIRCFLQSL